jgi:ATP-binding cassette subfamily B protein
VEVPDRLQNGIRLRDVTFRYPASDTAVLSDVDLLLPAGATVAILGENGAGKSTLVKLLCRFYEPAQGTIEIDGTDLRRIPAESWRRHIAAGFQDFARLEFLARETVGVGDLPQIDSTSAVTAALKRAHGADVIDRLPKGLESPLGLSHPRGGVELSGGQWQKLALGRAMMRAAPLLLVLDEPTASLDAESEHQLFTEYAAAAKRIAARTGGITLLVSHRFSTALNADLILVIEDGRVAESGDHQQLMAAGGLYAELYGLQAEAYR